MTPPRRWRPSLALVLGGALAGTLVVALAGLVAFRYLAPEFGNQQTALTIGALIALVTALPGWLLVRLLLRPVRALEAYAKAMGDAPEPVHFGTRETHATAGRVIEMTRALRDRETTVRAYTDHVTHELKTPVAAIRAAVELMQDGGALGPEDARLLAGIDGARRQMEEQLAALRRAAQAREVRYLGETTLSALRPVLCAHDTLSIDLSGGTLALPMSKDGLAIVLGQLVNNAAEHGATSVGIAASASAEADGVEILVRDNGPGISQGNAARIFDPFFTTRREAGGTGMGLAVVANILTAHRGGIALVPSTTGAVFRIWLTAAR